jgi:hypothetical protein
MRLKGPSHLGADYITKPLPSFTRQPRFRPRHHQKSCFKAAMSSSATFTSASFLAFLQGILPSRLEVTIDPDHELPNHQQLPLFM